MFRINTFVSENIVINNGYDYKFGEILCEFLNSDFSEILKASTILHIKKDAPIWDADVEKLYKFMVLTEKIISKIEPYQKIKKELHFESKIFKDLIEAHIEMYENDNLEQKDIAISEFENVMNSAIHKYFKLITSLKKIDGFYRNYLENYYHNFSFYPKSKEIAQTFTKYFDDHPASDIYNFDKLPPRNVELKSTPVVFTNGFLREVFIHDEIESLLYFDFMTCVKNEVMPKKCKHCGRFYVPSFGFYSEFCTNIAPNETIKTCREIGSRTSFAEKLNSDPILKEYQKAYKTHHARFVKKRMTKEELDNWKAFAKKMRDKALADEISFEDYLREIKV